MTPDSRPTLCGFNPRVIPYQYDVIKLVRTYDYSKGSLEILLSGSVGSAKSILLAHLAVTHCLMYPRSCVALVRKAMPDLKRTIFKEVREHIEEDLEEGRDFVAHDSIASITFRNGSQIISTSCADKRYSKVRSLKLSMIIIEELIELNQEDAEFFMQLKARLRRLPHVKENALIGATNPDSPAHWAYGYFIEPQPHPTRKIFYSNTFDNPFLDKIYIEQLRRDYDPRAAERFIFGKWIELTQEVIYYAYDKTHNYRDSRYRPDTNYPIHVSFDFNIGDGKPLSCVFFQFIDDVMHIFNEVVIHGIRTMDACDEAASRGLFDYDTTYIVNGDATGRSRDTRSIRSDYDIIKNYMANFKNPNGKQMDFKISVPLSNPPVRTRHMRVNAYCCNERGERRLFVYKDSQTAEKGLRLTSLKKGATFSVEDDSKEFQHITTAIGYGLVDAIHRNREKPQSRIL